MYSYKPHLMIIMLLSLWTMLVTPAQATCPISDHLCTYHALGRTQTSYNVDNDKTRLVIYGKALTTSHGDRRTDFDNHVLLPTETKYFDKSGNVVTEDTGPYINSRTSYAKRHDSDVREWDTPTTKGAHVYSSQYEVIFNKSTAKAIHSGDLNGGERRRTPYQSGCPDYENKANCEAVIITGNVPTGTYSQKIQMFNHYKKKNPKVNLELGAWATGQGTLVTPTHKGDNRFIFSNTQYNHTDLEGSKAQTQQFDYTFYNRGFNPHAMGTTSWDHNQRYRRVGVSGSFRNYNNRTGNIDIQKRIYSKKLTDTTTVDPFGQSTTQTKVGPVVSRDITLNSIGCTDGFSTVSCGQKGVVELNADGSMSEAGKMLKAQTASNNIANANGNLGLFMSANRFQKLAMIAQAGKYLSSDKNLDNLNYATKNTVVTVGEAIEAQHKAKVARVKSEFAEFNKKYTYNEKTGQLYNRETHVVEKNIDTVYRGYQHDRNRLILQQLSGNNVNKPLRDLTDAEKYIIRGADADAGDKDLYAEITDKASAPTTPERKVYIEKNAKLYTAISQQGINSVIYKWSDEAFLDKVNSDNNYKVMVESDKIDATLGYADSFDNAAGLTSFIPGAGKIASKAENFIAKGIKGHAAKQIIEGINSDDPAISKFYKQKAIELGIQGIYNKIEGKIGDKVLNEGAKVVSATGRKLSTKIPLENYTGKIKTISDKLGLPKNNGGTTNNTTLENPSFFITKAGTKSDVSPADKAQGGPTNIKFGNTNPLPSGKPDYTSKNNQALTLQNGNNPQTNQSHDAKHSHNTSNTNVSTKYGKPDYTSNNNQASTLQNGNNPQTNQSHNAKHNHNTSNTNVSTNQYDKTGYTSKNNQTSTSKNGKNSQDVSKTNTNNKGAKNTGNSNDSSTSNTSTSNNNVDNTTNKDILPSSYKAGEDGSFYGPKGGKIKPTGKIDAETGKPVYQRETPEGKKGGYVVVHENGIQSSVPSPNDWKGLDTDLRRPYLRQGTRDGIDSRYTFHEDGSASYIDEDNIKHVIQPPLHYGHNHGWENRRILEAADQMGWDQKTLNNYINDKDTLKHFSIQNANENMSHKGEKPGRGELGVILESMRKFQNK